MYKFYNGRGAVVCDRCKIIFDADLSLEEYEESYGQTEHDGDFCVNCLTRNRKADKVGAKDMLDDGWTY